MMVFHRAIALKNQNIFESDATDETAIEATLASTTYNFGSHPFSYSLPQNFIASASWRI